MWLIKNRLIRRKVPNWPKLAWLAAIDRSSGLIEVLHGPCVETNPGWCVEAVWSGKFSDGDFDRTELVFGTGVRVRDDHVRLVSSGDPFNRLHQYQNTTTIYVSNSLPALLASADLSLLPDYDYGEAMHSITKGLYSYVREIPSTKGTIRLTYFYDLVYTERGIDEAEKSYTAPRFDTYAIYRNFLFATATRLCENASAGERQHRIVPLTTISKGYDSPAAAVIARFAGVQDAVTIATGRRRRDRLFDLDDSGENIAEQLGLRCRVYSRSQSDYPLEDAVWASVGNIGDLNLTVFDYPQPLCLLFTGFLADVTWCKRTDQLEPLCRSTTAGTRFSESRLELGVFNCSPAAWGCRFEEQIRALSLQPEMRPWTIGGNYDRPIPRRIVEEAGVLRGSFAIKKQASSFNRIYGRPLSPCLRADFTGFLRQYDLRPTTDLSETAAMLLRTINDLVLRKLPHAIRFSCNDWITLPPPTMLFLWANERRKQRYNSGLDEIDSGELIAWRSSP